MKILVSAIYGYNSYSRGIMPDVLQTQIKENPGAKIFYLTNSNSFKVCYFNTEKNPESCYRCTVGIQNTLQMVEGNFSHLTVSNLVTEADEIEAKSYFQNGGGVNFSEIYENFEVGAATLSTYISTTRDRELINSGAAFVKELACNALALYLAVKRFIAQNKIDLVYNFNGRHGYVRAVFRAALANSIDCINVERARPGGFLVFYKNALPHNIKVRKEMVENNWSQSNLSEEEKVTMAEKFFRRQKSGESVIFRSYTAGQEKGHLPKNLINGNKNIVLFNSSDDEFAALGAEFENPLFTDQFSGIEFLVNYIGRYLQEYNLVIRMHPNLKGVHFRYVEKIREQHQRFPNIFVVPPEDKTDTYALLEISEKVITFGSTLGLEANFWRKPVILLGKSYHYFSNVAYTPHNLEEIKSLLFETLKPKPTKGALKFGFYFLSCGIKARYYFEEKIGQAVFFKGKKVHFYSPWERIKSKGIGLAYRYFKIRFHF